MQSESYNIIGDARLREPTVAAIMSDDPESCPNQALDKAIKYHQRPIEKGVLRLGFQKADLKVGVDQKSSVGGITKDVEE
jgi:hypothetical protein